MREWFSGKAPKIDWSGLVQKRDIPTRNGSAACLGVIAEQVPNMIVSSADLSNNLSEFCCTVIIKLLNLWENLEWVF